MTPREIVSKCSKSEARSVLYFAARYIKQASYFEKYKKDIFADEPRVHANKKIREVTLLLIKSIEKREGKRSAEFDGNLLTKVLDEITDIEDSLLSELSDQDLDRAKSYNEDIVAPERSSDIE